MPLLRIVCPATRTDHIVRLLEANVAATGIAVVPAARPGGGDLVLAEVPRSHIDPLLMSVDRHAPAGVHLAVQPSEQLLPPSPPSADDYAVVWAEVVHDIHASGRLSWVNLLLIVIASAIAAIGISEGQLLLIVGAMALSPDYLPIANTYLALSRRAWRAAAGGGLTLLVCFTAAATAAWLLAEVLAAAGALTSSRADPLRELTLFIAHPNGLSVVVALLAGVAGALAITLPGARGLVGVFVSVTTIPAAANIGVAVVNRDPAELAGATVQLLVNVAGLLIAGAVTLVLRHRGRAPRSPGRDSGPRAAHPDPPAPR